MYIALVFSALIGFILHAVYGVESSLFGHELDIEAWSEASDMESLKYHWIDGTANSVLDKQAHLRILRALDRPDAKMQRTLNTMQNALLRDNTLEEAAFMICENVVEYCDIYEHLNICEFKQWQDICVRTCDDEFNCEEGEVETCGVTEYITEEFKEAFLAELYNRPSYFSNNATEIEQAFDDIEELSDSPPHWHPEG